MTTEQILNLARIHNCNTSSRLRLCDAQSLADKGRDTDARRAALDSLRHSVGVFHPAFKAVTA